jgi:type II secretory pathway pseudopilin PulG
MNRRSATTLVEVLVAIFIMGIGLLAILALFPLGALQMAQALKDDRAAQAAANATALARVIWKQACDADAVLFGVPDSVRPAFREGTTTWKYPRSIQRFVYALDDPLFSDKAGQQPDYASTSYPGPPVTIPPVTGFPPGFPGFRLPPLPSTVVPDLSGLLSPHMKPLPLTGPDANRSSYPVFLDMFGWQANSGNPNQQFWVGGANPISQTTNAGVKVGLIPRRPLFIRNPDPAATPTTDWLRLGDTTVAPWNNLQRIYKQFSLLDDMTFTADGVPANSSGLAANNPLSAIERQGRYSWAYMFRRVRNKDTRTQVDVSVVVYSGRSLDVATDEKAYQGTVLDDRLVQLSYATAADKPALKRGQWLLDATIFDSAGAINPQAKFYRVVNVDDASSTALNVELQTPLGFGPPSGRVFIVMSNVVEVFQIGEISQTSLPRNILDDQEF